MNANTTTSAFSDQRNVVRFQGAVTRITINDIDCAWNGELQRRLEELIKLPHGWDGYQASPVSFENANFALRMLERLYLPSVAVPNLVPGYDGDLQAEWHQGNTDVELHVLGPNDVHAWRVTPTTDPDGEELMLTNDFTVVGNWMKELADTADANAAAAA